MKTSVGYLPQLVKCFLEDHWDGHSPLLIAYSGGPDSKALLLAALKWGKAPLHIAHVDHGWRETSAQEAKGFQEEAARLNLPFHTIRLQKKTTEAEARLLRLAFFRSLRETIPFQAVLLGHQANDLAETVLKRIFEGAHFHALFGMNSISRIEGVDLWRPLLQVSRSQILDYLHQQKISFFTDPSNQDSRYLRARMRSEIIPFLNKSFGKNVVENLNVLSNRSIVLNDYFTKRLLQLQEKIVKGPFGDWLDGTGLHRVELELLLFQIFPFSRQVSESILDWIEKGVANREIEFAGRRMIIDRGHFFLLHERLPCFKEPIHLSSGTRFQSGDWIVEETSEKAIQGDWRSFWFQEIFIQCPKGDVVLQLPPPGMRWKSKVPAFLRQICPVIMSGSEVIGDFLSGRTVSGSRNIKILIQPEHSSSKQDTSIRPVCAQELLKTI